MEVRARAPGKIILSGEHAVVHGSTAVAAAIDLHTYVSFRLHAPSDNDDGLIELELKDFGLAFSWSSQRLRELFSELGSWSPRSCSTECLKVITSLVEELSFPEAKIGLSSGVSAFLYLYTSIVGFRPGKVRVTSELPLASGLGSSASFCVSVSAALLALSGDVYSDNQQNGWLVMRENELELVNKWAFEGEKIIHGKPSGIDNTVSTFGSEAFSCLELIMIALSVTGSMIMFRLGELTRLKSSGPLRMLITNTKVGRNTKALVAGVSERAQRHPDAMAAVFTAVDSISKELSAVIESFALDDVSITAKEEKLEELMEMNQGLLQCMGVSHTSIETVLRTTLRKYVISTFRWERKQ
ncbi:hypothetical protein J5N97_009287 [Dioscorea zingiberensis]|uniref:Mevalonate kinase n=1 Tax=Dioscorea zingiberensis TaxID=325984 RepID=A0A9D5HMF6_9LILI|nr:hypothetical protein J5N97_009287 [Dioscorea zingiberensis]